jgi:hypothetical protein
MDESNPFDQFHLGAHGDRHEQEFWPFLSDRFPSYEVLWRRLIVPLTRRIDLEGAGSANESIRLRPGVSLAYERASMCHYSVFYFLGRAVQRFSDGEVALEHPEDVLFLLDSVGDNFKHFLRAMNDLGADSGRKPFPASIDQFPRGFEPFPEISDYRDTFLHNAVIARGVGDGNVYVPKWHREKARSPLKRVERSWRAAQELRHEDLTSTEELLERLINEACHTLEWHWQQAIAVVASAPFQQKLLMTTGLKLTEDVVPSPPAWEGPTSTPTLGSNTNFVVPAASGTYVPPAPRGLQQRVVPERGGAQNDS